MNNDFDDGNPALFGPVVFRPDFNNQQAITASQAWSLFFTGSNEDQLLGATNQYGRFLTQSVAAIGVAGALWAIFFTGFPY
jgi:hypothetical protein